MRKVVEAVREGKRFLLSLHRQPDGDSIGASLAIAMGLRQLGKEAIVATPDPIPSVYGFLPGREVVQPWEEVTGTFDAVLLFDCADEDRTGAPKPLKDYAPLVINVDHHATNRGYGDITFIDPLAAAVAEIALRLLDELRVVLEPDIALCLYTAIVTDTGSFRYASTSPQTHRIAARLLDAGLDPGEISEHLFEQNEAAGLKLLARALSGLKFGADGRLAMVSLSREDMEQAGAGAAEAESLGIVNYARSIRGVEVGVLLRQDKDGVKASLRSRGAVDVAQVAFALGGGGHSRAAGVSLPGKTLQEAETIVLGALTAALG